MNSVSPIILFLFLGYVSTIDDNEIVLKTDFGYVKGTKMVTAHGYKVDAFRGIPFANKPERLKKSTVVNPWSGIIDATNYSLKCIPNVRPQYSEEFSEDCLYLNIFTPSDRQNDTTLPVAIFIHGGGFQEGFGNDASCDSFADKFVSKGIIIVTIQYRLAALGFLSLGCDSDVLPCNIGLWDQAISFEFINQTIKSFGGDNKNMTLFGHSAGSTSTSIHSISPITSKYFRNFIELSGSSWSISTHVGKNKQQSLSILDKLKCPFSNQTELLTCINGIPLSQLYSSQIDASLWPEMGDDLIPDLPSNLVNRTRNQNLFIGIQTLEMLYFTYLKSSPEIFPYIGRATVSDYINSSIAPFYGIDSQKAFDLASEYFIPEQTTFEQNYSFFMRQETKIQSNIQFDIPVLREIREKHEFSENIFVYHFKYFNEDEFDPNFPVKETYHCQEFPYIWDVYKDNYFEMNENDEKVSNFFIESLTNFIKFGNPSSSDFTWLPTNESLLHVIIQPNPVHDVDLFQNDYNFWDHMRKTFQYDLITDVIYNPPSATSSPIAIIIPSLCFIISLYYSA